MMIDVVQALELFEICADEMAGEELDDERDNDPDVRRKMSLTARALAKRQLHVAHLARFPLRGSLRGDPRRDGPTMTLGAAIVFRTADKFGRAGASTERTLDAVYRAVQRYIEMIPCPLQDGLDKTAIAALMAEAEDPSRIDHRPHSPSTHLRLVDEFRSTGKYPAVVS